MEFSTGSDADNDPHLHPQWAVCLLSGEGGDVVSRIVIVADYSSLTSTNVAWDPGLLQCHFRYRCRYRVGLRTH